MPSPTRCVNGYVLRLFDQARYANPYPNHILLRDTGFCQYSFQSLKNVLDHLLWVILIKSQRIRGGSQFAQGQIKKPNWCERLSNIHADKASVVWINCQD